MKLRELLLSQSIRFIPLKRAGVYVPDLIKGMWQRYGFVRIPTATDEILAPDWHFLFEHGQFKTGDREILIQSVRVLNSVVGVETRGSTDDSTLVLDDFLEWGRNVGIVQDYEDRRLYISQIEFGFEIPFERTFAMMDPIARRLGEALRHPTLPVPPLQVHSVAMNADPTKITLACEFRIERRANVPYDQNVYFSQAPLKTDQHLALLQELEDSLREYIPQQGS